MVGFLSWLFDTKHVLIAVTPFRVVSLIKRNTDLFQNSLSLSHPYNFTVKKKIAAWLIIVQISLI